MEYVQKSKEKVGTNSRGAYVGRQTMKETWSQWWPTPVKMSRMMISWLQLCSACFPCNLQCHSFW